MPSYCCSSSDFLQSHYTVLLSSFLLSFFIHLLMLLFTSLYFSDPSGANLFFLPSLLLLHRLRISAVTQGFFLLMMFVRISLAVSVTAVLKVVIIVFRSVSSLFMMVRGANFPPIIPPKGSRGCLMSPPCLESQGCHLIPLCYLLSCSSA